MQVKLSFFRGYFVIVIFLVLSLNSYAIWQNDMPSQVTQMDGTEIDVFLSGDEFHNWVHDEKGFTIIQDEKTGDWCWAISTSDGNIRSSGFPIHLHTPESLRLSPGQNISEERYLAKREWRDAALGESRSRTPSIGVVQNLVIFFRFSNQGEFTRQVSYFDNMLNAEGNGVNSQYQYFYDASYQQLQVYSPMFPVAPGSTVISYQSTHPRGYVQPYNQYSNPGGYTSENQGMQRLHEIMVAAITYIANEVPPTLNIDADNDNYIDNICFILRGPTDGWADILWPHRFVLQNTNVFINGKRAWDYNLNIEDDLAYSGNGTLSHEFAHSLGMPDLYRYSGNYTPVGNWCLMGSAENRPIGLSAYMKEKYTQWVPAFEVISQIGTYTLHPVTQSQTNHAYRINSPYSTTEYFVIEYRRAIAGQTDANIYGSGILVYRINTLATHGNMEPPDEVYVYRPNGTLVSNGAISSAHFNQTVGRTQMNDTTNPWSFLSNGQAGGLSINNIGLVGDTISFDIAPPNLAPPTNLTAQFTNNGVVLNWSAPSNPIAVIGYKIYRNSTSINQNPVNATNFTDSFFYPGQSYTYSVAASYQGGESPQISANVNTGSITLITNFPYEEGFEANSFPPTGWGIYDADSDLNAWELFTVANQAHTGTRFAASASRAGVTFYPNNWLITPKLQLPENMYLSYYIGSTSAYFFEEYYSIMISTTGVEPANFTSVFSETLTTNEWQRKEINLTGYAGQEIFIAFRHHNVSGRAVLKLDDVRIGGQTEEIDLSQNITKTRLIGNYPNPFNPNTSISFSTDTQTQVTIDIYNIKGQKIKQIYNDFTSPGTHNIDWDGTDETKNTVSSGIYFYQMKTETYSSIKRMILLK